MQNFTEAGTAAMSAAVENEAYGGKDWSGNCLYDLAFQLGTLFLLALFLNNTLEIGIPWLKKTLKSKSEGLDTENMRKSQIMDLTGVAMEFADAKGQPDAEREFTKVQYEGTFADYDELVVQFGYVVLFVMMFPVAPLLALFNNILEFQLDGNKLLKVVRRPHPRGAYDIGTWYDILLILTWIGVLTNVGLVVVSSSLLQSYSWFHRICFFLAVEHFLVFVKAALSYFIPDEPTHISVTRARNQAVAEFLF